MYSRAYRRHHDVERWAGRIRRLWFSRLLDCADDPRSIGIVAGVHGTHDCFWCKYEKVLGIPKKRHESRRIFD